MILDVSTVTEIFLFDSRNVVVVTEQQHEILIIRTTSSSTPEKLVVKTTSAPSENSLSTSLKEENLFILSVSTAPVLLQTNARPKRTRGSTLDYKTMYEDKQNQSNETNRSKRRYNTIECIKSPS